MYKANSFARVNLKIYIEELVDQLFRFYRFNSEVRIAYDLEEVFMDSARSVSLALILNELITNCFKHAFAGMKDAVLEVSLFRKHHFILVMVKDNGQGITTTLSDRETLGLKLLEMLTRQLKGFYEMKNNGGLEVCVQIPFED
jgi:two-component sensor histidine kinase